MWQKAWAQTVERPLTPLAATGTALMHGPSTSHCSQRLKQRTSASSADPGARPIPVKKALGRKEALLLWVGWWAGVGWVGLYVCGVQT